MRMLENPFYKVNTYAYVQFDQSPPHILLSVLTDLEIGAERRPRLDDSLEYIIDLNLIKHSIW